MTCVLVVAKAPVVGRVKTRLGATVGAAPAAVLAAAALMDTLDVCEQAFGVARCALALSGDLGVAEHGKQISRRLEPWTVFRQRGGDLATRLENAHHDAFERLERPVVQIGMDTPQITGGQLRGLELRMRQHDVVLAPAVDGGWWALGTDDPSWTRGLGSVPMSTEVTADLTRRLLVRNGARVAAGGRLRDVDDAHDADEVSLLAPTTRFARTWLALRQKGEVHR